MSLHNTIFCTVVPTIALVLGACGDNSSGTSMEEDASQGNTAFVCDPAGAIPENGKILNAPLDSDVEIITKEARHPGDPGPDGLP